MTVASVGFWPTITLPHADIAHNTLYSRGMGSEEQEQADLEMREAADTVRTRELWLDESRARRDVMIYDLTKTGRSLQEVADLCQLSKSAISMVVRIQEAMRINYVHKDEQVPGQSPFLK